MSVQIYQDGAYSVSGQAEGRTFKITISKDGKSQSINFYPADAYQVKFTAPPKPYQDALRKQGANPADYEFAENVLIRAAAATAIKRAVADWQKTAPAPEPEIHRCERCGDKIEGEPVWNAERVRGIKVHTPYCQSCAKLLRVFAGGIGAAGESLSPRDDDNTPYTKGDF